MARTLKYKCRICQRPIGYDGLCWKCDAERRRNEARGWTAADIAEKQRLVLENLPSLEEHGGPVYNDFCKLMSMYDAITPEIQKRAVEMGVYSPYEIFYHAPEEVRDRLIDRLMNTNDEYEAGDLMLCLAMQGDDRSREVLYQLECEPPSWHKFQESDPSVYAWFGGWTFDKDGKRIDLNYDRCYPIVKGDAVVKGDTGSETSMQSELYGEDSPIRIARASGDICPHCGGRIYDMLVLDGRDERLKFLGIDGILTAACCPNCVGFLDGAAYCRYTLDGGRELLPSKLFDGSDVIVNYCSERDYSELDANKLVLGSQPVPLFWGAFDEDLPSLGGFPNWVQDSHYTVCPDCGRRMKYLMQIPWSVLVDGMDGMLYIEVCTECGIVSLHQQQT